MEPVTVGALLPACDAVITHGGVGLVGQSLCAGVPVFLLAQHAEQALLARRMVQQNLGMAMFKTSDKAMLEQKMHNVLHGHEVREAVQNFARKYAKYSTLLAAQSSVAAWQ